METLPFTTIKGTPSEIGEALGRLAQPVMRDLAQSGTWQALQPWRGHAHVKRMMAAMREALPDCWAELEGMARGIGMDVTDLFLWNCRTDLLEDTPDSSVSIAINRLANGMLGHCVSGDAVLAGQCHVVDITPRGKPGFIGFYCPGTLPGLTFAASRAGLVQVTDVLHVPPGDGGLPGFALCRTMLDATSLPDAIEVLVENPRAGGLHQITGWAGEFIMASVEATPHSRSLTPIARNYGHANHAIHEGTPKTSTPDASRRRQARVSSLLGALPDYPDEVDLFRLLSDDELWVERDPGSAQESEETRLANAVIRFTPHELMLLISIPGNSSPQRYKLPIARQ